MPPVADRGDPGVDLDRVDGLGAALERDRDVVAVARAHDQDVAQPVAGRALVRHGA